MNISKSEHSFFTENIHISGLAASTGTCTSTCPILSLYNLYEALLRKAEFVQATHCLSITALVMLFRIQWWQKLNSPSNIKYNSAVENVEKQCQFLK